MADLTAIFTVNATKSALDTLTFPQRRGNTVAMSTIGEPCVRRLWFNLHWVSEVESIDVRLRNLFGTGTRAEDFIIEDLERIGIKVTKRQEEVWGFMKHAHGFTDGRCENVPDAPKTEHLLEIKTHNDRNFKLLLKSASIKKSHPKHFAQVQRYMRSTKLKRCLYVGYNKNDSAYYIERVRYDAGYCDDLERKERDIILSPDTPRRPYDSPSWFECKYCEYNDNCYSMKLPAKNCRTCEHCDLAPEGGWVCELTSESHAIPKEVQITGCDSYLAIKIA